MESQEIPRPLSVNEEAIAGWDNMAIVEEPPKASAGQKMAALIRAKASAKRPQLASPDNYIDIAHQQERDESERWLLMKLGPAGKENRGSTPSVQVTAATRQTHKQKLALEMAKKRLAEREKRILMYNNDNEEFIRNEDKEKDNEGEIEDESGEDSDNEEGDGDDEVTKENEDAGDSVSLEIADSLSSDRPNVEKYVEHEEMMAADVAAKESDGLTLPPSFSQWFEGIDETSKGVGNWSTAESFGPSSSQEKEILGELDERIDDEDLLGLCSGNFLLSNLNDPPATVGEADDDDDVVLHRRKKRIVESDDEDCHESLEGEENREEEEETEAKVNDQEGNGDGVIEKQGRRKVVVESDEDESVIIDEGDEEDGEEEENNEEDSDDELAVAIRLKESQKFFDEEAELSGEDSGSDGEEDEAENLYEAEEGDQDVVPDVEDLRADLFRQQLKKQQAQDHKELAVLQQRFFAYGDLAGEETNRSFRLKLREELGNEEGDEKFSTEAEEETAAPLNIQAIKYRLQQEEQGDDGSGESEERNELISLACLAGVASADRQPVLRAPRARPSLLRLPTLGSMIAKETTASSSSKQPFFLSKSSLGSISVSDQTKRRAASPAPILDKRTKL